MGNRLKLTLVLLLLITTAIYSIKTQPENTYQTDSSYYPKKAPPYQYHPKNRKIKKQKKIAIGSPKDDIIAILGTPHSIDQRTQQEIWHYPQGYLFFTQGKVTKIQLPTNAKHTAPPNPRKPKFVPAKRETHRTAGFLKPASLRYSRTYSKIKKSRN